MYNFPNSYKNLLSWLPTPYSMVDDDWWCCQEPRLVMRMLPIKRTRGTCDDDIGIPRVPKRWRSGKPPGRKEGLMGQGFG